MKDIIVRIVLEHASALEPLRNELYKFSTYLFSDEDSRIIANPNVIVTVSEVTYR